MTDFPVWYLNTPTLNSIQQYYSNQSSNQNNNQIPLNVKKSSSKKKKRKKIDVNQLDSKSKEVMEFFYNGQIRKNRS